MAMRRSQGSHTDKTYRVGIIMGLTTGGLIFVAGFVLSLLGLTGTVELILEGPGLTARLTNSSPGVAFALLGMVLMWRFKPIITETVRTEEKKVGHASNTGITYNSLHVVREENKVSGSRLAGGS